MKMILHYSERIFDWFQKRWESVRVQRALGTVLVASFIWAVIGIQLNRWAVIPQNLSDLVPLNHLAAIDLAFNLMLILEVVSLVLYLARSVADAVGKQFEILSLILLRDTFQEFSRIGGAISWDKLTEFIYSIVATAIAALLIFVILGYFYSVQKHRKITQDEADASSFIAAKKVIALTLLISFIVIVINDVIGFFAHQATATTFESLYTLLIFSDVLIVLISIRYGSNYHVSFRNSGFAVATIFIRLALIAPLIEGAILGVGTALFALGITLAYNSFAAVMNDSN
ncbi:MAG: hypothetical protein N2C13_00250 [Chloroflexota bacterium]